MMVDQVHIIEEGTFIQSASGGSGSRQGPYTENILVVTVSLAQCNLPLTCIKGDVVRGEPKALYKNQLPVGVLKVKGGKVDVDKEDDGDDEGGTFETRNNGIEEMELKRGKELETNSTAIEADKPNGGNVIRINQSNEDCKCKN